MESNSRLELVEGTKVSEPVAPTASMERLQVDMSVPPTQSAVYTKHGCSCWEFNIRRGIWYKVKIPEELTAGDKFVVTDASKSFHVVCKVPPKGILREPSIIGNCERGGGVNELILHWTKESVDFETKEKKPECFVQGSRVEKENLCLMWKYFLPIPYLCMYYVFCYNGMAGGACEEMKDMEWCERIEKKHVGSMPVIQAIEWERQKCNGDSGINSPHPY